MLNNLVKYAEVVRNRYKFDIDEKLCADAFFKAKLQNDKAKEKTICNNIYKKLK